MKPEEFKHVEYRWNDADVENLDAADRLTYRSNILGDDGRVTNTGGGNTSSKALEIDPISGEQVEVMWVKGSGGDLRTSKRENFSSLYMDKLMSLIDVYNRAPEKGVKTEIEDAMVGMYNHVTFNLNPRASSIDTPLHGFIPYKHVDHTHPNAAIAVAACKDQVELTQKIYGGEVGYVGWQRPGFDLGLVMREEALANPNLKGLIMGQHGLINWSDDDKECYELSLELIEKAARYIEDHDKGEQTFGGQKYSPLSQEDLEATLIDVLPWLRGQVSQNKRFIGTIQTDETIQRFVNSNDAARLAELGTSCPDHFLRTKIKPLFVDWNPQTEDAAALKEKLTTGLEKYRSDYADYYETHKRPGSPAMRDQNPTVILIPGIGMVAFGKNKSESRVTAEFYNCAVEVMRGAEAISTYDALPMQEAFDIEYWALEEAKLQRMPPEKEFERKVVVVVGAGSGIGREVAHRMAQERAHVVCVDLKLDAAEETAKELTDIYGQGIGVAGSGISGCGPAIGLSANMTDRENVKAMFEQVVLAYGGIDTVIVTAGIFVPPSKEGQVTDDQFSLSFDINVKGLYIVAQEAEKIWKKQNLSGSLVLTTSVNAVVAKKGSVAYDCSKAAANHLVRELAVELSPLVRVNGLAPATVVKGSAMFPRDRVIASLTKYDIAHDESEDTESLRNKLAEFYAQRTLTKAPITPADQAEAAYLLASDKLSKTTGQIISVDGGLHEAFLR
ncbi:bifunctional rhamnulose-1-phosphate aldolase/short-chain dehydrogenase [Roseibacillus persicicus]|uniref:Short chain dehydrogenase n=1 Tax=Roseibacillus persicicus TaxID=454148 RepID=A0A918TKG4_9BACT|nr:bifunctional rhamnulose-1-phosphate aldolase/short-chain dehydrogenase [Roseibacillus persicicus]GHC53226.1 short chain dehydrogenase [Roseibacillus persicicus]